MSGPEPRFQPLQIAAPSLRIQVAPATPELRWRTVIPTPTPPPSAVPILALTAHLRELTRALRRLHRERVRHLHAVARWAGTIRALRGLTQLMAESYRAHNPGAAQGAPSSVQLFAQRARELHEAMCAAVDLTNPLPRIYPTFVRALRDAARDILDVFRNGEHIDAVRTLRDDAMVPRVWKYSYLAKLHEWIGKACRQIERTPLQAQLAGELELGLTTDDDNLVAAARTSLPLEELDDGLPALAFVVKQANLAILGAYARRQFAEIARSPSRCRRYARELVDDFLKLTNLERERTIVEQAVGSGSRTDMEHAHERIAAALEGEPILASAMAIITYATGFAVLAERVEPDDGAADGLIWGLNPTGAAVDAAGATVTVYGRALALRDLSRAGLRRALRDAGELAETAGTCAMVVTSIFEGVQDIMTHLNVSDEVVVLAGNRRLHSGAAIAAGVLLGIESANPMGAALGLAGAASMMVCQGRDASVPFNRRLREGMVQYIRQRPGIRLDGGLYSYQGQLDLEAQMSAVVAVAQQNDWWGVRGPAAGTAASVGSGFSEELCRRLQAYGLPRSQINAITDFRETPILRASMQTSKSLTTSVMR